MRTNENGHKSTSVGDLPLIETIPGWHEVFPVISKDHLYEAARTGELRVLRRGRRVLVSRSAMLAFLGEGQ